MRPPVIPFVKDDDDLKNFGQRKQGKVDILCCIFRLVLILPISFVVSYYYEQTFPCESRPLLMTKKPAYSMNTFNAFGMIGLCSYCAVFNSSNKPFKTLMLSINNAVTQSN